LKSTMRARLVALEPALLTTAAPTACGGEA
jgi:hypothetical protein